MQYSRGLGAASRRSLSRGWLAVGACAVAAALLAGVVRAGAPNLSGPSRLVGRHAPDFSLAAEQSGSLLPSHISLDGLRGQPAVLVFFNSLCVHCGGTAQAVVDAAGNMAGTRALFIDSPAETATIAGEYAQRLGVNAPILLDADGRVAAAYGIMGYPVTLLIDGAGIVRETWTGDVDESTLMKALVALTTR